MFLIWTHPLKWSVVAHQALLRHQPQLKTNMMCQLKKTQKHCIVNPSRTSPLRTTSKKILGLSFPFQAPTLTHKYSWVHGLQLLSVHFLIFEKVGYPPRNYSKNDIKMQLPTTGYYCQKSPRLTLFFWTFGLWWLGDEDMVILWCKYNEEAREKETCKSVLLRPIRKSVKSKELYTSTILHFDLPHPAETSSKRSGRRAWDRWLWQGVFPRRH